jgi:hypothetical protein
MKNFLLLGFFTFLCTCVSAQEITGLLMDGNTNEPLPFANVSVYGTDEALVRGTSTDLDGRYRITALTTGTYRLEASFLGYANQSQTVTLTTGDETLEIPPILLLEGGNDLSEITVTGGVYFRDKTDLITRVTEVLDDGVQLATVANLDSGRDYGVEAILNLRPSRKFNLTASANACRRECSPSKIGTSSPALLSKMSPFSR